MLRCSLARLVVGRLWVCTVDDLRTDGRTDVAVAVGQEAAGWPVGSVLGRSIAGWLLPPSHNALLFYPPLSLSPALAHNWVSGCWPVFIHFHFAFAVRVTAQLLMLQTSVNPAILFLIMASLVFSAFWSRFCLTDHGPRLCWLLTGIKNVS